MKEKWVKFFRGGMSRPTLNTDRVLKNTPDSNALAFIDDQY